VILVALVAALWLEHALEHAPAWRRFDWARRYAALVERALGGAGLPRATLGLTLVLLPPVGLLAAVTYALDHSALAPLRLALDFAVLYYCLGPMELDSHVREFSRVWSQGNIEAAEWYAVEIVGPGAPVNPVTLNRAILEAVVGDAHRRLFGPMFWLVAAGPAGALLYRLGCQLQDTGRRATHTVGLSRLARALCHVMDWVPARLGGIGYALAGSFVDAARAWQAQVGHWRADNRDILINSGLGALHVDPDPAASCVVKIQPEQLEEALRLVWRTAAVWLVVLALLTLGGWLR
jgi:adenosylcobinamide-phosphate synthase